MPSSGDNEPVWRRKKLVEMTAEEWESLCDGCGRCCLHKLLYQDTGELEHTNVACHLLDLGSCRCRDYARRRERVLDCIVLTPEGTKNFSWLPRSCAYRLIAEGKDLAWWHPLVSGNPETVHQAGISVRGRAVHETPDIDLIDHVVDWPD